MPTLKASNNPAVLLAGVRERIRTLVLKRNALYFGNISSLSDKGSTIKYLSTCIETLRDWEEEILTDIANDKDGQV